NSRRILASSVPAVLRLFAHINEPGAVPWTLSRRLALLSFVRCRFGESLLRPHRGPRERDADSTRGRRQKGSSRAMTATPATLKAGEQTVEIKLAHSPDSDDAFMFYALATH